MKTKINEIITKDNFFKETICIWRSKSINELENIITKDPDFISDSGSKYWYGTDEGGEFVVRHSDHWIKVNSCYWFLNDPLNSDKSPFYSSLKGKSVNLTRTEIAYAKCYFRDMYKYFHGWFVDSYDEEQVETGRLCFFEDDNSPVYEKEKQLGSLAGDREMSLSQIEETIKMFSIILLNISESWFPKLLAVVGNLEIWFNTEEIICDYESRYDFVVSNNKKEQINLHIKHLPTEKSDYIRYLNLYEFPLEEALKLRALV